MRVRISTKGQLVLPRVVREARGMVEGAEVEVLEVPGGVLLQLVRATDAATLDDLVGCGQYQGRPKTLDEMSAAIRRGARERR